jgi:hypothetical protein
LPWPPAGLIFAPWLWRRVAGEAGSPAVERWGVRMAGLMLAAASGWALTHGLWHQVAAYCGL